MTRNISRFTVENIRVHGLYALNVTQLQQIMLFSPVSFVTSTAIKHLWILITKGLRIMFTTVQIAIRVILNEFRIKPIKASQEGGLKANNYGINVIGISCLDFK